MQDLSIVKIIIFFASLQIFVLFKLNPIAPIRVLRAFKSLCH